MSFGRDPSCPVIHGSPVAADSRAVPLYGAEFTVDPVRFYQQLREQFGPLAPVELASGVPATLVVGYAEALKILHNPGQFPADPRGWQHRVPPECPIVSELEFRPNPMRTAGADHDRYRGVHADVLGMVDQHAVQAAVVQIVVPLINAFSHAGTADLRAEFALPLVFGLINQFVGISTEAERQLDQAITAVSDTEDGSLPFAVRQLLRPVLAEVVQQKRAEPGHDLSSSLITHAAGLRDEEVVEQLALTYDMSIEPTVSLILNTTRLMLTDEQLAGQMLGGAVTTGEALDEVLFHDPPLANACVTYPRGPQLVNGHVWLRAHEPVLISLAACNRDPAINQGDRRGNRSHLSWGIGEHACPASEIALVIAATAIDQLMDALPDMTLAVPADRLMWRPDLFHRSLTALPVLFPPAPPLPAL